jgi:hypothetical protein
LATLVLAVPTTLPGSPLSELAVRALDLARQLPPAQRRAAGALRGLVGDLETSFADEWVRRGGGTFSDPAASGREGDRAQEDGPR